jgi:hypothetical protein
VERPGKASARPGKRREKLRRARGAIKSGTGAAGPREDGWQGRRGRRKEETEELGLEEEDEDRSAISQNCRDSTIMSW